MPDICNTPSPAGTVPIPYPNIAQLADAIGTSAEGGNAVFAGGKAILLKTSKIAQSTGDEAGTAAPMTKGEATFTNASSTVLIHRTGVVRFGDPTTQNGGNASGSVLSTPVTVLVGG
jgi:hypothetical protein